MKILSIVGARPQFIKLAPLCKAFNKYKSDIGHLIVHTGQHYDANMSDTFFKEMEIPEPDYNLNIGSGQQGIQTGQMLAGIEEVLLKEKPEGVIVFGDTNSTLAGALAAVKLGIKSFHIEAGLRSFNRSMPEEINRIVADHTCDWLYAPTITAVENLKKEGLFERIVLSGDIMVDSVSDNISRACLVSKVFKNYNLSGSYYLLTLHRPYNVDSPVNLNSLFQQLTDIKKQIIFPVHPRTQYVIDKNKIDIPKNIMIIPPQGYFDFLNLQYNADKIITDSGGIQKEAYILKKPCITLRSETEWVETIKDGWNILVDYKKPECFSIIENFNPDHQQSNVFGKKVADKIVSHIFSVL